MDPFDTFLEHISTSVVPETLPRNPMRWNMQLDRAKSELASSTKSSTQNVCSSCFVKTIGIKKTPLDNFKRVVMQAKHVDEFRLNEVMREKHQKVF
ncbi:hypothetical protein TNCV_822141 [Trichonephila clavipes]|nr:hypothetical protein TNCV_822141 [Trichonephila clavipes]